MHGLAGVSGGVISKMASSPFDELTPKEKAILMENAQEFLEDIQDDLKEAYWLGQKSGALIVVNILGLVTIAVIIFRG